MIARVLLAGWVWAFGLVAGGCGGSVTDQAAGGGVDAGDKTAPTKSDATTARGAGAQEDGAVVIPCSGGGCPSPGDVSGFVPIWRPPTGAHQGLCTPALIDEYYQNCLAVGGTQGCDAFGSGVDQAHQACGKCISSNFSDSAWAPLVRSRTVVEANGAGCIALLDPSAIDCAKAVQGLYECEHAACDSVCGSTSATGFDDWDQCTAAANTCGCKSWFDASDCIKQITADGGPAAQCLVGQTFEDFFTVTAAVFCGS